MKYRAEIDGLRALAVLPVILFHAGFELFSGGFVGVDVFFVISGYLITTILMEDIENDRFSIANFYERRARRILPALFFVMLCCIPFAWMWMMPGQMKAFAQSILAVSLFASNVLFWRESGYFAAAAEEKPLLHTWSLAVEEQYYVLFPVFLFLAWRFGKNRVFWTIVVFAAISLALSEWGWRNKPEANFYLAPTRAWELFAGSIVAFAVQKRGVVANNSLALTGLIAILASIFLYDSTTPFPSLYALLPVGGVVLIVLYADASTQVAKLLSTRVLVGIGLISYSAYLWHQPLFAFARIRSYTEPSTELMLTLSLLSVGLAVLSWKYVELPFRTRKTIVKKRSHVVLYSGVGFSLFLAFGLSGHIQDGFGSRNEGYAKVEQSLEENNGLSSDCEGSYTNSKNCRTSPNPKILLWGDSFAMHLAQGIVSSAQGVELQQHTISACPPVLGVSMFDIGRGKTNAFVKNCIDFNSSVLDWLRDKESVEVVVLSSPFNILKTEVASSDGTIYGREEARHVVQTQLLDTITKVRELGKRVVVVSPTPRYPGVNIGKCLRNAAVRNTPLRDCDFPRSRVMNGHASELMGFLQSEGVPVIDLADLICEPDGLCKASREGVFIYRDKGHLTKEGSALLGREYNFAQKILDLAI